VSGSHIRRRHRIPTWALVAASVALLGLAGATVIHIEGFYARSHRVGTALITSEQQAIARADHHRPPPAKAASSTPTAAPQPHPTVVSCKAPSGTGAVGLLEIPRIGLTAPIVQGDSAARLAVAVGHDPGSDWPGGGGTVVLDGHDVTWFHHLPELRPGATIKVAEPCATWTYRVAGAKVVVAGTPVEQRPGLLALVTCYPLDALFFTDHRYLLTATQIAGPARSTGESHAEPVSFPVPAAGVPAPWSASDSLAANPTPLGTLHVTGTPSRKWSESPAPLNAAANAQQAFFAALRQAETSTSTWRRTHPRVTATPAVTVLAGQQVTGFLANMGTELDVAGTRVTGATITDYVSLSDGATDNITARLTVEDGAFRIVSWAG